MLENLENYYMYEPIAKHQKVCIHIKDINLGNWRTYYDGLINIMKDGIELKEIHECMITLVFPSEEFIDISIPDLFINLILWYPNIALNIPLGPQHLFIEDKITANDIKEYIDFHVIEPNRSAISNIKLNNIIADMICNFVDVDFFSMYLSDTLNLEDDVVLMQKSKEFYDLIHCDLSNVPIEKVKDAGMDIVYKAINIIMNSKKIMGYDHYLKNAFAAKEGINIRQYKENHFNIGTKPDGQGSIYHEIVNQSYITGGLNNLLYQLIDSGSSRVAQIISKRNVGESGGFSRILGLNNINSFLHPDPNFDCHTKNFMHIFIPDKKVLERLDNRYYRIHPKGQEFLLRKTDTHLIGQHIYLRSPITCASKANGTGICYKCYGNLAYTNADINVGRISTEIVTSIFTQNRLSAKHLLETQIDSMNWNDAFKNFFIIETNAIKPIEAFSEAWEGYKLVIDLDQVQKEDDDEFFQHKFYDNEIHVMDDEGPFYNEYVTEFILETDKGVEIPIHSIVTEESPEVKMYFTTELTSVIRDISKKKLKEEDIEEEDRIVIPMEYLEDTTLFFVKLQNNDLGKSLDMFKDLINKKDITKSYSKDQMLERLIDVAIKGRIDAQSIHFEMILSNQIKSIYSRLKEPNWYNEDEPYELITLNEALRDNTSVINSLTFMKLAKALYYPLTYKKKSPSIFDLFFMNKPKKFLEADHEIYDDKKKVGIRKGECPIIFFKDHDGPRPKNIKELLKKLNNLPKTELDD